MKMKNLVVAVIVAEFGGEVMQVLRCAESLSFRSSLLPAAHHPPPTTHSAPSSLYYPSPASTSSRYVSRAD